MKIFTLIFSGVGILGLLIITILSTGAPLIIYADTPSLIFLLGLQILVSFAFAGIKGISRSFTVPFNQTPAPADLRKSRSFWVGQTPISLVIGGLGILLGVISLLQNPSYVPGLTKGAALCLLVFMYVLVLNLILFFPMKLLCERRLAE